MCPPSHDSCRGDRGSWRSWCRGILENNWRRGWRSTALAKLTAKPLLLPLPVPSARITPRRSVRPVRPVRLELPTIPKTWSEGSLGSAAAMTPKARPLMLLSSTSRHSMPSYLFLTLPPPMLLLRLSPPLVLVLVAGVLITPRRPPRRHRPKPELVGLVSPLPGVLRVLGVNVRPSEQ